MAMGKKNFYVKTLERKNPSKTIVEKAISVCNVNYNTHYKKQEYS
jgi:hypothetical protein